MMLGTFMKYIWDYNEAKIFVHQLTIDIYR